MKLHTHHRLTGWIASTMARLSVRFAGQQSATSGALQLKPYGLHAAHPLRHIRAFAGSALMTTGLALACLTAIVPPAQARGGVGGGVVNPNAITVGPATPAGGPVPFDITGAIQSLTVLSPGNAYSGGSIIVNGITVIIPANLVVTLPAAYKTVGQIFMESPLAGQSGLAFNDPSPPIAAYEASMAGNIVNGVYLAGLVSIAQQSLNTANGFIRSIDYATGFMCVGSTPGSCGANDARVMINDPDGRYGLANGTGSKASPDKRFGVDSDNPTIHARSGYPMCVPRVTPSTTSDDPKCPMTNRPKDTLGAFMPLYVMDSIAMPAPAQFVGLVIPPCPLPFSCNVNEQAPLVVGDYITYSGILAKNVSGGIYVAAYALEANVGIYTRSGVKPFYMYMDAPLISTGPAACPANAECQARLKTSIFVTDPFLTPAMYAVDETLAGDRTSRQLPSTLTNTAVLGRFVFVTDKDTRVLGGAAGVTREIMGRAANLGDGGIVSYGPSPALAKLGTANGLVAGQYVSPVGSYIFLEPNIAGGILTPYNFRCLAFLVKGWGQGGALKNIGKPIPFPEAAPAPTTVNCTF